VVKIGDPAGGFALRANSASDHAARPSALRSGLRSSGLSVRSVAGAHGTPALPRPRVQPIPLPEPFQTAPSYGEHARERTVRRTRVRVASERKSNSVP
jgi:hypothetical protein